MIDRMNAGYVNDPAEDNKVFAFGAALALTIQGLGQKVFDLDGGGTNFALPRYWTYTADVAYLFDPSMISDCSAYMPIDVDTNYI